MMTMNQKIESVKARLGEDDEVSAPLMTEYLLDAKEAILSRMYPFGVPDGVSDVPPRYERLQCRLAVEYLSKRGAEGETSHNENGVNRYYNSANADELLREVMQIVSV